MSPLGDGFLPYEINNLDEPSLQPSLTEINESAESRAKCLRILRQELRKLQDIEPCMEDDFLLRFLRVSKFNTSTAFQRILKYYDHQEVLLDAFKKVSLPVHKFKSLNYVWYSPYRLKNNSSLVIGLGGKIDYSILTFAEMFYSTTLIINRFLENPVNQIGGITMLLDYKGFNFRSLLVHTPSWIYLFAETFEKGFPVRIKAVHLVNAPTLFLAVHKIVYPFLSKKMQERLILHPNDGFKSLHAAISPEILSEEYGGKLKSESYINGMKNMEELQDSFLKIFRFGYIKTKNRRQSFSPIFRKE